MTAQKSAGSSPPGTGQAEPVGSEFALNTAQSPQPTSGMRAVVAGFVQLLLVVALIAMGLLAYRFLMATAPVAERGERQRIARLVDVAAATATDTGPRIIAWGEVAAAQTLIVRPEIAGRVEWVHPEVTPGGVLSAGTEAARLDPSDLALAVLQAKADIADIEARILLEKGQAAIGERELSRLSRTLSGAQRSLVLREPQMAQLDAELAAAEAVLEQTENALKRTRVIVPFDAMVVSESIAPGSMLSAGMEAATLVSIAQYHVVLRVPAGALEWIALDGTQKVTLHRDGVWPEGAMREGRVVRLNAGLSDTGRMAELIVELDDPLALRPENAGLPKVLLGSFIEGRIDAVLPSAGTSGYLGDTPLVSLDRAYLRDNDTVWVMGADDTLEIREVDVLWRGPETVLLSAGIAPGDRIVETPLPTYAPGMKLRTRGARP